MPTSRVHSVAAAAADPVIMLTAPIPATQKVLKRAGLTIDEIGVLEVNKAFAPVPLAWRADLGANEKNLNPQRGRQHSVTR
jgi:acetyl-CoA acyltransferase